MIDGQGSSSGPDRGLQAFAAIFAIVAIGLILRVGLAERPGLWADEFFSLAIATGHSMEHPAEAADAARGDFVESEGPVAASVYARYLNHDASPTGPVSVVRAVLLSDTNPPLYYLALWAWTLVFGTGDASLRFLSIAWWVACLPPLGYLASRLEGPRAILPTLLFFCVVPAGVFFATEGRMYSMLCFVAISTAAITLSLNHGGGSPARLAAWVACSSAGLLTHYFFVFPWAACIAWLAVHPGRVRRETVIAATMVVGLAVAPWYVNLSTSLGGWRVTRDWIKWRPEDYSLPRSFGRLAWKYVSPGAGRTRIALTALGLVLISVATIRQAGFRRMISPSLRLPWAWLLAALLGPLAFDLLRGTYTVDVPRYAIAGFPAACLLLGVAMARLRPVLQLAIATVLIVPWTLGVLDFYHRDRADEPYLRIGESLARDARDGDVVIVHSIPTGVAGIARYLEQFGGEQAPVVVAWVGQLGRRKPEDLAGLIAGRKRIRLVSIHTVGDPPLEEAWLYAHAKLTGQRRLETATILDFAPLQGGRFPETAIPSRDSTAPGD